MNAPTHRAPVRAVSTATAAFLFRRRGRAAALGAVGLALLFASVSHGCGGDASSANPVDGAKLPDAGPEASAAPDATDTPPWDAGPDAEPPPKTFTGCDSCIADGMLAARSPWPKFRGNMSQTAASKLKPKTTGGSLWKYKTGKGIFSSPIVAADGTVYIGSADRGYYAFTAEGKLRWKVPTGEIIDSAGLLDDRGRLYFGSGDGKLRAVDAQTGVSVWTFAAEDPSVNKAFINWFEGNVAIGRNGNLYVPNDNFSVYAVDRNTGKQAWKWLMNDQTWSLPAVDPKTGVLYIGNNYLAGSPLLGAFWKNTFAIDENGQQVWRQGVNASIAASAMLASGKMFVGAFDGYLRAYDPANGNILWSFGSIDHLYSSPALLPDGSVVQPSTDGTIYALDPDKGTVRWSYAAREPFRSSPAVDGDGHIYVGGGDGRLYVLNADGKKRFSIKLIEEDRNDLNASPALGEESVYIGGENGEVFSVPYDYCLRPEGKGDARCDTSPDEALPKDGVFLYYNTPFGSSLDTPPTQLDANQPIALSLFVRAAGSTVVALIDEASLQVTVDPPDEIATLVSGDRRFFTVQPKTRFSQAKTAISVSGNYLVNPTRDGLKFTGGTVGGTFKKTLQFDVSKGPAAPALSIPKTPGDASSVFELYRCAVPLPTILPSYNQIGFDSLHYLLGMVEGTPARSIAWFIGGMLDGTGKTLPDPATKVLFPVDVSYEDGLLTMTNESGFSVNAMNADISFDTFRASLHLGSSGQTVSSPVLHVTTNCNNIPTYGTFLVSLGFCNPNTGIMNVFGSYDFRGVGSKSAPSGLGTVAFAAAAAGLLTDAQVTATFTGNSVKLADHSYGLLLVDPSTGKPVSLQYGLKTTRTARATGEVDAVTVSIPKDKKPANARAYLMVDTYPAAVATLTLP